MQPFISAFCLSLPLFIASLASAQDLTLPSEPEPRAIMRSIGVPRGYLAMWNTTVVRDNTGAFQVYYGYIFGNMQRDGIIYVANDLLGIACQGTTQRQADKSGLGEMICIQNGQIYTRSPVEIGASVYGKLNGIDSGIVLDANGRQIGTVISQWDAWDFPDAAKIAAMWK